MFCDAAMRPSRTASKWKMASVTRCRSSRFSVRSFHRLCVTWRAAESVTRWRPATFRYSRFVHFSATAATPSSLTALQNDRSSDLSLGTKHFVANA